MGPSQERIPQPVPDPSSPGHYMKPFEIPTELTLKKSSKKWKSAGRLTLTALPPNLQVIRN